MYTDLFGSGIELQTQLLTIITIIFTSIIWLYIYWWRRKLNLLPAVALPILLWFIFGTLDITITARAIVENPLTEGNIAARWFFVNFGILGPSLASFCWISLWVGLCVLLEELSERFTKYKNFLINIRLVVYYSLFFGHLIGFMSWIEVTHPFAMMINSIQNIFVLTVKNTGIIDLFDIMVGIVLTLIHLALLKTITLFKH